MVLIFIATTPNTIFLSSIRSHREYIPIIKNEFLLYRKKRFWYTQKKRAKWKAKPKYLISFYCLYKRPKKSRKKFIYSYFHFSPSFKKWKTGIHLSKQDCCCLEFMFIPPSHQFKKVKWMIRLRAVFI